MEYCRKRRALKRVRAVGTEKIEVNFERSLDIRTSTSVPQKLFHSEKSIILVQDPVRLRNLRTSRLTVLNQYPFLVYKNHTFLIVKSRLTLQCDDSIAGFYL